jgi:hypothetical protein
MPYTTYEDEEDPQISYRYIERKDESLSTFCCVFGIFIITYMVLFHMIF